jgi:hypothetical protein
MNTSRIARFDARIRNSCCPRTIAALVARMTEELDPAAISSLIGLLDYEHDSNDSVSRALLRYGEAAEESLRAVIAADPESATRIVAEDLLRRMAHRARLREVGCFRSP